jgi:hypothetical protein
VNIRDYKTKCYVPCDVFKREEGGDGKDHLREPLPPDRIFKSGGYAGEPGHRE